MLCKPCMPAICVIKNACGADLDFTKTFTEDRSLGVVAEIN